MTERYVLLMVSQITDGFNVNLQELSQQMPLPVDFAMDVGDEHFNVFINVDHVAAHQRDNARQEATKQGRQIIPSLAHLTSS